MSLVIVPRYDIAQLLFFPAFPFHRLVVLTKNSSLTFFLLALKAVHVVARVPYRRPMDHTGTQPLTPRVMNAFYPLLLESSNNPKEKRKRKRKRERNLYTPKENKTTEERVPEVNVVLRHVSYYLR